MAGIDPPFDLCGLSLGALTALRYAGEHPDRVRRLVVCAGFTRLPLHLRVLQRALTGVAGVVPAARLRRSLVLGLPEEHRAAALAEIQGVDVRRAMRAGASFRLARLPSVPTLVLCGERDRINLKLSRRLAAALPDARFELVPDAAHVANLDNPEAFTELLRAHLDSPPWP